MHMQMLQLGVVHMYNNDTQDHKRCEDAQSFRGNTEVLKVVE